MGGGSSLPRILIQWQMGRMSGENDIVPANFGLENEFPFGEGATVNVGEG